MAAFLLDAKATVSCRDLLHYEQNILFRLLVKRFGTSRALALHAAAEASLAVAMSLVFRPAQLASTVCAISLVFAIAHFLAWRSNKKFLGELQGGGQRRKS